MRGILERGFLSLWGGLELETGLISDVTHPRHGASLTGKILAMGMTGVVPRAISMRLSASLS